MQLFIVLLLVLSLGGKSSGIIKEIEPILNVLGGGVDLDNILNGDFLDVVNGLAPAMNDHSNTKNENTDEIEEYATISEYPLEAIKNFADEKTLSAMSNYIAVGD